MIDLGEIQPSVRICGGYAMLPGIVPGEGQYVAALRKNGEYIPSRMADPFLLFRAERPASAMERSPEVDVNLDTALRYLHGDALKLPEGSPLGIVTITYKGQALGQAKNIGSRCNNLYPKANRIRMSI